ncbi:MAG TPA: hypothetical protein VK196_14835 [Magnetospirillum sp.]|nr:hypothetical protein [Magnetospirillum sp.]
MIDTLKNYLGHWQWNLALVEQPAADIVAHGIRGRVRWLPTPPVWRFLADPFVLAGRLYCEHFDYRDGVGQIWSGAIDAQAEPWAKPAPLLREAGHMSFPFAFNAGGADHIVCETWESGGASHYVRDGGWHLSGRIDPGFGPVVDPALYHDGARWWLFCGHIGRQPDADLYLYHADDLAGPWQPHPLNPVVRDRSGARSAGPLFPAADGLVRPAQDCSQTYGGALTLKVVAELSPTAYVERTIRRIAPLPPWRGGLHHLCPAGEVTIVDGKRWRLHPLDLPRKVFSGWRSKRRRAMLRAKS